MKRGVCNVGRETGNAISKLATETEHAVKTLRNEIAKTQGVDPDKIKRKLSKQIKTCNSERMKVQNLTTSLKKINQEVKNFTLVNPDASYAEIENFVQQKIDELEKVKLVSGNVSLVTSNIWSYYFFGQTSMPVWASVSGPAALIAISVIAMLHSVQEEINKEKKKLVKCSNNYKKDLDEFTKEKSIYLKLINDEKAGALISKISAEYDDLIKLYFLLQQSSFEESIDEYRELKLNIENQIVEFKNKFNSKNELIIKIENSLKTLEI